MNSRKAHFSSSKRQMISPKNLQQQIVFGENLEEKISHFKQNGGISKLAILTDFDYTLTRYTIG